MTGVFSHPPATSLFGLKTPENTPKSVIFFQKMYYNELETNWKHQTNLEIINLQYKIVKRYHPKHSIKITETFKYFEKTIS